MQLNRIRIVAASLSPPALSLVLPLSLPAKPWSSYFSSPALEILDRPSTVPSTLPLLLSYCHPLRDTHPDPSPFFFSLVLYSTKMIIFKVSIH